MRPRFYFSFRSPYSWLGYRDLIDGYPAIADALEWRPFWEPDELSMRMLAQAGGKFPYVDHSPAKARYILQDVRRLARKRGLTFAWPVDRSPCWEVPHLAYLAAARLGRGREFIEHVYRCRWEQGRDITDPAVMGGIAARLGLPAGLITGAAGDLELRKAGCEALQALDADGVFGVPFFICGYDKFWGVERLSWFVETLRSRGEFPAPVPASVPGGVPGGVPGAGLTIGVAADHGHPGGCG